MRNLLVVVDMQNDFIDGSLGTKEAVAIVDNVIAEIAKYDTKDIFATRDTHPENYLETQEGSFRLSTVLREQTAGRSMRK